MILTLMGDWKFHDIGTEQSQLKSYVSSLNADTKTEKSNLGDAIRRALVYLIVNYPMIKQKSFNYLYGMDQMHIP